MKTKEEVLEAYNNGFTSMAARKRCLDTLRKIYDDIADAMRKELLRQRGLLESESAQAEMTNLYYDLPELHNWRSKHNEEYKSFATEVVEINQLVELRNKIKAANIVPKPEPKQKLLTDSILKMLEGKRGMVDLSSRLGLSVAVNVHHVSAHDKADYTRCFYYLNGEITSLHKIVAIIQARSPKQR